ncbi:MAG: N-acetylmuramoyl-L-alanine amidase [Atopobiaceae bacterium]|nr:N-acetylmuramoyl-L-alanine amidase [Atopobiaceae bacterium]
MTQSSLATKRMISPNTSGYRGAPSKITVHHTAGVISADGLGWIFADPARQASCNYGVGNDGEIICILEEEYWPWTSSSGWNDSQAVTLEVSNSYAGGDWPIGGAAWNATVALLADVCTRWGIWPEYDETIYATFTEHRMFAATGCVPVDTEVLTRKGWVKIGDISEGDEIACASLDDLSISFEIVEAKVPVKEQDTYTNHGLTATKDHRIVYAGQYNKNHVIDFYGNVLEKGKTAQVYIPLAGVSKEDGLDLTDDMISFYIAVQADAHYMHETKADGSNCYYGVEFHFAKERKVKRIKEILEAIHLDYSASERSDGTHVVRVYNQDGINIVEDICERHLCEKDFTWEWLGLSQEQSELFFDELLMWDGSIAGRKYTSRHAVNLDIVSAIAATHGVGSKVVGESVHFRCAPHNTLSDSTKRHIRSRESDKAKTTVTCVTVKTGIFLIRQNGKTFIVGNCPGDYIHARMNQLIAEVRAKMNDSKGEWHEKDGKWWYEYPNGTWPANKWEYIDERWYFFDEAGWMMTGWVFWSGQWYYCLPKSEETGDHYGWMLTGWQDLKYRGKDCRFYFDPTGAMFPGGFHEINGRWYAFDSNGVLVKDDKAVVVSSKSGKIVIKDVA